MNNDKSNIEDNAYYRARLALIDNFIKVVPDNGQKNNDHVLLRNGLMPASLLHGKTEYEAVKLQQSKGAYSNNPLTFTELCRWNTWFSMHPEKVAGKEIVTTSREFPITIKGTKEDIILVLTPVISKELSDKKKLRIRIAKAKAKAKLKLLELQK